MRGTEAALPGAAAERGIPEFAVAEHHVQSHVTVGADEILKGEGASAATGEAVTVSDVAVMGQLARAVTVGAGAGGEESGGHGFKNEGASRPLTKQKLVHFAAYVKP